MNRLMLDSHKLAWHKDRVDAWLRGERIAPITIDCSLTRRCTYRCVYCYGQLQANDEKHMTRDVIFRFLDDAAEIGVKAISFVSDGESTCSAPPLRRDSARRRPTASTWPWAQTDTCSKRIASPTSCQPSPISASTSPPPTPSGTPRFTAATSNVIRRSWNTFGPRFV